MKHIRLENNRIRFPTLPRFDKWMQKPRNEALFIAGAVVIFVAVVIWGASL